MKPWIKWIALTAVLIGMVTALMFFNSVFGKIFITFGGMGTSYVICFWQPVKRQGRRKRLKQEMRRLHYTRGKLIKVNFSGTELFDETIA